MLDASKHKIVLVSILKDIYSDKEISSLLGLKGGTAGYLFYNLPRFSVDLDFSLLEDVDKDFLISKIENILKNYGVVQEARIKRFTIFFLLSYGKGERKVKVEISKRVFPEHYQMKNYLGISVLVISQEDMAAHKLVAFLDRKEIANRGIFNIRFFLKNNWRVNEEIIRVRTKLSLKEYLEKCIERVEGINSRRMLEGLGDLLNEKQKDWAKQNLKKDVLFLLRYYYENA